MERTAELALMDELLDLKAKKSAFLDDTVARNPVDHYVSEQRFESERSAILQGVPSVAAHISELEEPGSFVRRDIAGLPVLLTHDKDCRINAFLNVCRHRGTRLVEENTGCQHRFSCPYHAWTYSSAGDLLAAPHYDQGFSEEDKATLALRRLGCTVRFGFVWIYPIAMTDGQFDDFFKAISDDLSVLGIEGMGIAAEHSEDWAANWKILVEGGLEAYHFKVAHRTTIGPYFENNLSSYQSFGPHIRSILPRATMAKLNPNERETWQIREHANILYTLFPNSSLLVQQDHIVWITQNAVAPDKTTIRVVTLAPKDRLENRDHWQRNHDITCNTLNEDFEIGASIQSTLKSGANTDMLFGRFEGALDRFNKTVNSYL